MRSGVLNFSRGKKRRVSDQKILYRHVNPVLLFCLDTKSNKKVKPISCLPAGREMYSLYDRAVILQIGAGTPRKSKGIEREEVAACYM